MSQFGITSMRDIETMKAIYTVYQYYRGGFEESYVNIYACMLCLLLDFVHSSTVYTAYA